MSKKAFATCRICFSDEKQLEIVLKALKPEVEKPVSMRSEASLGQNGDFLVLKVEASDSVALRATLNAYLRWINSILEVLGVVSSS